MITSAGSGSNINISPNSGLEQRVAEMSDKAVTRHAQESINISSDLGSLERRPKHDAKFMIIFFLV